MNLHHHIIFTFKRSFLFLALIAISGEVACSGSRGLQAVVTNPVPQPVGTPGVTYSTISQLQATATGQNQITLAWIPPTGITGTRIEIANYGGAFATLTTLGPSVTSYVAVGLIANTQYSFRAVALYGNNQSDPSMVVTATALGASGNTFPPPFTSVLATATSSSSIRIDWAHSGTNVTSFLLAIAVADGGFIPVASVTPDLRSYTLTGLNPATTYTFLIEALNGTNATLSLPFLGSTLSISSGAPAAPSALQFNALTSSSAALTWVDASDNETSFQIYRATGAGDFALMANKPANSISYLAEALAPNTTYRFQVFAVNAMGSTGSNILNLTTPQLAVTPPNAPTSLSATTKSQASLSLTWNDTSNNETGFDIYKAKGSGDFAYLTTTLANVSNYDVGNLDASTTYRFQVFSVNSAGKAGSNIVTQTTSDAPPTIPSAPGALTVGAVGPYSIPLSWADTSQNETSFALYRIGSDNSRTLVVELPANSTSYTVSSLNPSTNYNFQVFSKNSAGISGSNVVSPTTAVAPPTAPTGLQATSTSAYTVSLQWTDTSSTESRFDIYQAIGSGAFRFVASTSANSVTYSVTSLTPATAYRFVVYSVNGSGNGASNIATATTPDIPPAAPTTLVATAISKYRISLNWKDNSNNEGAFHIYRALGNGGFTFLTAVSANVTSYLDVGLHPGRQYHYAVYSVNGLGNGRSNDAVAMTRPEMDFNGDGKDDIGFAWNNGDFQVGISNGTNFNFSSWTYQPAWAGIFPSTSSARFFSGDFNGDGKNDVAFCWPNGQIIIGFSTGTSFNWVSRTYDASWGQFIFPKGSPAHFFVGDFNGDGKDDIAFSWSNGDLEVGISNGTSFDFSSWTFEPGWATVFPSTSAARFFVGDFNGDGRADIAFTWPNGQIIIGYSDGSRFNWVGHSYDSSWGQYVFPKGSPARFIVGDFNGDGKDDIAFTWSNGDIETGISNGTYLDFSSWTYQPGWASVIPANTPARFFAGDFSGSGKSGMLFTWPNGDSPMATSTGSAFSWASHPYPTSWGTYVFPASSPARFFAGDFNGDGKQDVAFTWTDGTIWTGFSNGSYLDYAVGTYDGGWGTYIFPAGSPARFTGEFIAHVE